MPGVFERIFVFFSGGAGPVFLAGSAGLLLWAAVERRLRRRLSRERETWRGRALDAERWAEAASLISRGRASASGPVSGARYSATSRRSRPIKGAGESASWATSKSSRPRSGR